MKTNMKLKGFTLIELLVVIVIIGILATISVATFSGYFAKARDTERQTFVAAARTAVQAEQIGSASTDFRLGGTTGATVEAAVVAALNKQGIAMPDLVGSAPTAYYVVDGDYSAAATEFAVITCGEEAAGTLFQAGSRTVTGTCASGTFTAGAGEVAVAFTTL